MTKTHFHPKISRIDPKSHDRPAPPSDPSSRTDGTSGDAFTTVGANPFKALISGSKPKADDTSLCEEMLTANDQAAEEVCLDPVQQAISNLMFGDDHENKASASDFTSVFVPKYADIAATTLTSPQDTAGAQVVLDRYEALKELIVGLIQDTEATLQDPSRNSSLTPTQVSALQEHLEELKTNLGEVNEGMLNAELGLEWAQNEAAAAKAAEDQKKEDAEWWNS